MKPTIDKTSDAVKSDCFTVQLEPVKCEIDISNADSSQWKINYIIKRNGGQGDLRQLALSFNGDMIYYSPTLISSGYGGAYLLAQQQSVVRKDVQTLDELTTISLQEQIVNNPNFNSDAIASGVTISAPAVSFSGTIAYLKTLFADVGVDYFPLTVTAYAIVGEGERLCNAGTQPITCSCIGSLCSYVQTFQQGTPKCTSLPCIAIVP